MSRIDLAMAIAHPEVYMQTGDSASFRALTVSEFQTLALASLGGALEFYDFVIFVFFTAVIGKLFFSAGLPDWMRQLQTFGIFAAGYLARPLGGVVMAHFGDIHGRKRMFTLSILLMAIPTLLIGCLPTYRAAGVVAPLLLLMLRVLQGVAIGGEAPGGWVFVAEHAQQRAGLAIGLLTSGLSLGILLGSLVAVGLNATFSQAEIASGLWRLPFVLGGVFGFIAMFLRRWLTETPVFEEMRQRAALSRELPLRAVLTSHGRAVASSVISTWMLTAAIVVVILMTPSLLHTLFGLAPRDVQMANLAGTAALCVFDGSDRRSSGPFWYSTGFRSNPVAADCSDLRTLFRRCTCTLRTTPALRARRFRCRRSGTDSHSHDSCVSTGGAVYGCLILLQHCLRSLRRFDSDSRFLARSRRPVQPGTLRRGCNNARSCGYVYDADSTPNAGRER
jgi:MFS family permease